MILLEVQMTTVIVVSVLAFLLVTLILVAILLVAKSKLLPSGSVTVSINDDPEHQLTVSPGGTLLSVLGENKILLPSACGGGGSCGMCECKVTAGGGEILPTEKPFFTRKEQQTNHRLACQVKVKENMNIEIPQSVMGIKKWECEVVSNHNQATFIKEFVVRLPEGENLNFKSGGYIQIDVPVIDVNFKDMDIEEEYRGDWDNFNMWDLKMSNKTETYRAYSMANHPAEGNIVMLNIRIATPPFDRVNGGFQKINPGICSSFIFSRKPGDKVNISGPFGEFFIKDTKNEMMFIGGGAGMAPMRSHIFDQFQTQRTDRKATYWYGARSRKEIFYEDDFNSIADEFDNFSWQIALSDPQPGDNWEGKTGFIHQVVFDTYLKDHEAPEDIEYYLCGPPMMNSAVQKMLWDLGVPDEMIAFDDFG